MRMRTHPCAQATVKIGSSRAAKHGDQRRDFREECICCPRRSPCEEAKRQSCNMAVFQVRNGVGHGQRPRSAVCQVCHVHVKTKHANTGNLYSHLKKHHRIEYQAVRPKHNDKGKGKASSSTTRECTIEESFKLATKLCPGSCEHKELTKAVTYYLAKDMCPAYSVELPGFRSVVSKLNPRYCLPDRNYFSRTGILTLYNEVREEVERELEGEVVVNFSGTTDLWTSGSSDPYITFTMHYIDSTWQLRSYCLGAMYLATY